MLNIDYSQPLGFYDAIGFGGKMLLLGMGAVFAVLLLIWVLLVIFKLVFSNVKDKKNAKEENIAPVTAPQSQSMSADEEIIAVIAAAIAMAESESSEDVKFKVVSFKRK